MEEAHEKRRSLLSLMPFFYRNGLTSRRDCKLDFSFCVLVLCPLIETSLFSKPILLELSSSESDRRNWGCGDAVLGVDGCIYWRPPPKNAHRILKHDPHKNQASPIEADFRCTANKWSGEWLGSDGMNHILYPRVWQKDYSFR